MSISLYLVLLSLRIYSLKNFSECARSDFVALAFNLSFTTFHFHHVIFMFYPPASSSFSSFSSVSFRTVHPPFSSERSLAPHTASEASLAGIVLATRIPTRGKSYTATPAAPARSAIELMMLGPRRFNNKPHYLQSALGSITTGCPPHLVVILSSFYSLHSRLPSL